MTPFDLAGIYPALPTFFDSEDRVDHKLLALHVGLLHDLGITQFLALGSNGEMMHLSAAERQSVVATVREAAGRDATVLAGASGQSVMLTLALIHDAARAGANAALVLTPFYYASSITQEVLEGYYREVAEKSPLPVVIYNMPAVTGGLQIAPETVRKLATHPNIAGIKDSSGDLSRVAQIEPQDASFRDTFHLMMGSGGLVLDGMLAGATGGILALANIAPRECLDLYAVTRRYQENRDQGSLERARRLQNTLSPMNTLVTKTYGVAGLKAALKLLHTFEHPPTPYAPRHPLPPLTDPEKVRDLTTELNAAGLRGALQWP